ncbi:MAG: VWA domain-containing protein [bacterium]
MERKILNFIELLRRNGCRVSPLETLDCFGGLVHTGVADRETFRNTLRATLVKSSAEAELFDELFEVFFFNEWGALSRIHAAFRDEARRGPEWLRNLPALSGEAPEALALALIENDTAALQRILAQADESAGIDSIVYAFQDNPYAHRLLSHMNWGKASGQLERIRDTLRRMEPPSTARDAADRLIRDLISGFPETVREHVRRRRRRNRADALRKPALEPLLDKNFFTLTEDEKRLMKDAVKKLAEKMKTIVSARTRTHRRGKLNVRKTLRRNVRHGGVPFHAAFEWKRKKKRQIVVLCDVSESVRYASSLMLHFVYCVQELFARVRSFVFVSELGEVTSLFNRRDSGAAFADVMNNKVIAVADHTNYGLALLRFHERFGHIVNKRTTVIVLGDARTNYADPRAWILKDVRRRAHGLVWLNPESRSGWDQDDSVMGKYEPYCDAVFEIRNTRRLLHAVSHITRVSCRTPG